MSVFCWHSRTKPNVEYLTISCIFKLLSQWGILCMLWKLYPSGDILVIARQYVISPIIYNELNQSATPPDAHIHNRTVSCSLMIWVAYLCVITKFTYTKALWLVWLVQQISRAFLLLATFILLIHPFLKGTKYPSCAVYRICSNATFWGLLHFLLADGSLKLLWWWQGGFQISLRRNTFSSNEILRVTAAKVHHA